MKNIKRILASALAVMMLVTSCPALSTELDAAVESDLGLVIEEVAAAPVEEVVEEAETALVDAIIEEAEESLIPVPEEETVEGEIVEEIPTEDEIPVEEEEIIVEERFREGYIWIAELTDVFADSERGEVKGIFPETAIAYALSRVEYEDAAEDMLEIMFAASGEVVTGYISADAILTMTEEEIEAYKANIQGNVVAVVKDTDVLSNTPFEVAEDEEPTEVEQPEEEAPAEESTSDEEEPSAEEAPADGVIAAPQIFLSLASDEGVLAIADTGSVTGIDISAAATVREKTTLQMNAAVTPEDANIGTVYWKSSNNSVATVNNDGVVTTKAVEKPTKVIITAYAADGSGTEARFELTVTPIVEADKVVISGVTNEVALKKSIKLYANVLAGEEAASIQNVTWKIKSGSKYASIKTNSDGSATITGKKAGKLTVIATAKDGSKVVSEPFTVVVKSKAASSVKVASINGITALNAADTGKNLALKATVSSKSASQKVSWSVDAKYEDIASVDQDGVLTIKDGAFGEIVVKATALDGSKKSGTLTVYSINTVSGINVAGVTHEVAPKKSITLEAGVVAAEGEPTNPAITWKSENTKIATVKANADGTVKVTGVKAGTVKIFATAADGSGKSGWMSVTVMPKAVSSVKIINEAAPFINIDAEDKNLNLAAAVSPANASQRFTWSVEEKYHGIANISEDGVLTATGDEMGAVVVKAAAMDGSGKSASLTVHVGKPVADISIIGMNAVKLKKSITLKAALTAADGTATVSGITWKLSGGKYASMKVNADGTVTITGKKAGKVTVTATANDGSIIGETGAPATATWQIAVKKSVSALSIKGAKTIDLNKVTVDENGAVVLGEESSFALTAGTGVFTWTSSNPELFCVDENGLVSLKSRQPGSAVITAVSETGKMGSVTVKALYTVTGIELSGAIMSEDGVVHVVKGASTKIAADVFPDSAANQALSWKTSNKKIATVSSSGSVKGVKAGTVTITATAKDGSGVKQTIKVTVHEAPKSVSLYKNGTAIKSGSVAYVYNVGEIITMTAKVSPAKAYQPVEWSTNNATVATVENGVVTVVGNGVAKITAKTVDGKNKASYIYVKVGTPVEEVAISGARSITIGKSTTLTADVLPENAINKAVTWKVASGYEAFASISASGVVKGKKSGYAKIIATADSGAYDEFFVYVAPKSTKVFIYNGETDITGKTTEMYRNLGDGTLQLSARLNPTTADQSVTWKSSSTKIATVDKNGVVTAKKNGTVTITATAADGSKKYATAKLKITTVSLKVEVISENNVTQLPTGASTQLKAVITPEAQSGLPVTWSSSDESLATVDANGVVTAMSGVCGDVAITAAVNGVPSEPYNLTVTLPPEKVIIWDMLATTIDMNSDVKTIELTAEVQPAGASQQVVWSSLDESVATVDQNGVVTAVSSGSTKIVATHRFDSSLSAQIAVKVVKLPKALELTIDQTRLYTGESFKITAVLTPEDVDNDKLNWKSSNEELVTVAEDGTVTVVGDADKATEVTITAETDETLDNVRESIELVVSSISAVFETVDDGKTITKYIGEGETVVRIPDSVEKIASGAFAENCEDIEDMNIGKNVTVESGALTGLTGMADANGFLILDSRLIAYSGSAADVTVPENVTRIDDGAFEGNTTITSVKMPNSITVIGKRAFAGCTKLSEMTCYD